MFLCYVNCYVLTVTTLMLSTVTNKPDLSSVRYLNKRFCKQKGRVCFVLVFEYQTHFKLYFLIYRPLFLLR